MFWKIQVGDTIWAEFGGGEDHIVPYPKGTDDDISNNNNNSSRDNNNATYVNFGDPDKKKINEEESDNMLSFPEQDNQKSNVGFRCSDGQNQTDLQSKVEMESWPDLPSLNGTLERDYSDGNGDDSMASAYLNDFDTNLNLDKVQGTISNPFCLTFMIILLKSLACQKKQFSNNYEHFSACIVTGGVMCKNSELWNFGQTTVQLEAQPDDFGNSHEGKSNSFLDCDWGNIGDFEDFDRLFR